MNEPQKDDEWKNPVIKGQILYGCIYLKKCNFWHEKGINSWQDLDVVLKSLCNTLAKERFSRFKLGSQNGSNGWLQCHGNKIFLVFNDIIKELWSLEYRISQGRLGRQAIFVYSQEILHWSTTKSFPFHGRWEEVLGDCLKEKPNRNYTANIFICTLHWIYWMLIIKIKLNKLNDVVESSEILITSQICT